MTHLYRVIRQATWLEDQNTPAIPRCGNDHKINRIHLNVLEAVESVAAAYFAPEECPIVLEIDTSGFAEQLEWLPADTQRRWPQPLANIDCLPTAAVVRTIEFEHSLIDGKNQYQLKP